MSYLYSSVNFRETHSFNTIIRHRKYIHIFCCYFNGEFKI